MNIARINRVIHRDLGFFCLGLTILYAFTGILLNHLHDWNSNYSIERVDIAIGPVPAASPVPFILKQVGDATPFKSSFASAPDEITVFTEGGTTKVNLATGVGEREVIVERPVLFDSNRLHLNHASKGWTLISDLYALALLALAITGLFLTRGRYGLKGRGGVLAVAGVLLPLLFLLS